MSATKRIPLNYEPKAPKMIIPFTGPTGHVIQVLATVEDEELKLFILDIDVTSALRQWLGAEFMKDTFCELYSNPKDKGDYEPL